MQDTNRPSRDLETFLNIIGDLSGPVTSTTTKSGLFYHVLPQGVITSLLIVYLEHVLPKVKRQFPLHIPVGA